jgi:hypothetical protein
MFLIMHLVIVPLFAFFFFICPQNKKLVLYQSRKKIFLSHEEYKVLFFRMAQKQNHENAYPAERSLKVTTEASFLHFS